MSCNQMKGSRIVALSCMALGANLILLPQSVVQPVHCKDVICELQIREGLGNIRDKCCYMFTLLVSFLAFHKSTTGYSRRHY